MANGKSTHSWGTRRDGIEKRVPSGGRENERPKKDLVGGRVGGWLDAQCVGHIDEAKLTAKAFLSLSGPPGSKSAM